MGRVTGGNGGGMAPQLVGYSGARTLPRLGATGMLKECYQNGALSNDHVIGITFFLEHFRVVILI